MGFLLLFWLCLPTDAATRSSASKPTAAGLQTSRAPQLQVHLLRGNRVVRSADERETQNLVNTSNGAHHLLQDGKLGRTAGIG